MSNKVTTVFETDWTVSNFVNFLETTTTRQLRKTVDPGFQLRMQLLGYKNDTIEIYYLSTTTVFAKSGNDKHITTKKYHTVQENK
ncbi:unnamed protein product [Leptidea sinapis]|uniref:Uncharacterized protein n=1 Tax=Leptidea sinapis TaxID=189913 RepID=A0A5E4QH00_9NEOP|nr:unnamed protein product [Leptidea sinapis]